MKSPHAGTVNIANQQFFFRPPVSVPLISLDQYRTERYSDNCMSRLGVHRRIRTGRARRSKKNIVAPSLQSPIVPD